TSREPGPLAATALPRSSEGVPAVNATSGCCPVPVITAPATIGVVEVNTRAADSPPMPAVTAIGTTLPAGTPTATRPRTAYAAPPVTALTFTVASSSPGAATRRSRLPPPPGMAATTPSAAGGAASGSQSTPPVSSTARAETATRPVNVVTP